MALQYTRHFKTCRTSAGLVKGQRLSQLQYQERRKVLHCLKSQGSATALQGTAGKTPNLQMGF